MVETSENTEGMIVLVGDISIAAAAFITASPIPLDWKVPAAGLATAVFAAIRIFWRTQVNTKKT